MNNKIDKHSMRTFLTLLFSKVAIMASLVICKLSDKTSRYFDINDLDGIIEECVGIANSTNVFFNVVLQDREKAKEISLEQGKDFNFTRGFKETTVAMPFLWMDIDIMAKEHKQTNLPGSFEEALQFLKTLPWWPTMLVNSGHGLHVYWVLSEPIIFSNDCVRKEGQNLIRAFQEFIREKAFKNHGWKLDNTSDITRMLRVVGSINYKDKADPKAVTIIEINKNANYSKEDFEKLLAGKLFSLNNVNEENEYTGETTSANIEQIERQCRFMYHCNVNAASLPEPYWYAWLSIIVRCIGGEEYAHKISSKYHNYNEEETQNKLEQALEKAGPRTCENINEITCEEFCTGCPHYGKIKSPIILGLEKKMDYNEALLEADKVFEQIKSGNKGAHLEVKAIEIFTTIAMHSSAEFERQKQKIRDAGGKIQEFKSKVKKQLNIIRQQEIIELSNKQINGAIISLNDVNHEISLMIPNGYEMDGSGTYSVEFADGDVHRTRIAYKPVYIIRKKVNIEENNVKVELCWLEKDGYHHITIDREIICDSRKILTLASTGFPINSNNSSDIVKYLSEYEAFNDKVLPLNYVCNHLGWVGHKNNSGFVLKDKFINIEGISFDTGDDFDEHSSIIDKQIILYQGDTSGDEQIASGFQDHGSFEEWKKIIDTIKNYSRVLMIFYSSFTSVLLEPLKASNFVIELANRTSTGKTTALRVAASVWGNPDEKQTNSIINSWDGTNVWFERASSMLQSIPLILDDTKRAKKPEIVAGIIYAVANGRGRGRGNTKSLAVTKSWRTVLISTGETPAIYFTNDAGTKGRVIEITGKPFGDTNDKTREIVNELNIRLKDNYGYAGVEFVKYVIQHKDEWQTWKIKFRDIEKEYAKRFSDGVQVRLCEYIALIKLTAELVNKALGLNWDIYSEFALNELITSITDEAKDASGERAALEYVISWANSHEHTFVGRSTDKDREPFSGWSGKWDGGDMWQCIAFYPNVLYKIIVEAGYDKDAILRAWKELGYLDLNEKSSRKYAKQIRVDNDPKWMIPIKRGAIENLDKEESCLEIEKKLF